MADREAMGPDRLPPPFAIPWLARPSADLVLRPWFDWVALRAVVGWYFRLSRGWAKAIEAAGSLERYRADGGVTIGTERRTRRVLAMVDARQRRYETAAERWTESFFARTAVPLSTLVERELDRMAAAHALMSARAAFLPGRWSLPPVRWSISRPDEVVARHQARLARPDSVFAPPPEVPMTESQRAPSAVGTEWWLRFPTVLSGGDDTAWAHVYEPQEKTARPTVIFLHGVAIENEMWRSTVDPINALVSRGFRVIRPEAPWHGRRRAAGWYGGEPVLGRGPLGFIDLFQAWVSEVAALIRWARWSGATHVVVGGMSLGALTTQLIATAANTWPIELRPDALVLLATSGDVAETALRGGFGQALSLWPHLAAAGWKPGDFEQWRRLYEPVGQPAVDPDRIVMVLGESDVVTPFSGGLALAEHWRVPAENLFVRRQGHFSVALGLYRDPRPIERLMELL